MKQLLLRITPIFTYTVCLLCTLSLPTTSFALQTGNGYTVYDQFNTVNGAVSGAGYTSQITGNTINGKQTGNGYTVTSGNIIATETIIVPTSGGGGGGGGGGATSSSIIIPFIQNIQKQLNTVGIPTNITGTVTPNYVNSIKLFQAKYLLPVTGLTDSATLALLNKLTNQTPKSTQQQTPTYAEDEYSGGGSACTDIFTKPLKPGSIGIAVYDMQKFLVAQGYTTPTMGYFGSETTRAVKQFQSEYSNEILTPVNLKQPSGLWYSYTIKQANKLNCKNQEPLPNIQAKQNTISKKSIEKILSDTSTVVTECKTFTTKLKRGSAGTEVNRVNSFLSAIGYDVPNNNIFTVYTETAVKSFQSKYADDILKPATSPFPTGLWYQYTMKKANEIKCVKNVVTKYESI